MDPIAFSLSTVMTGRTFSCSATAAKRSASLPHVRRCGRLQLAMLLLVSLALPTAAADDEFPQVFNTEAAGQHPPQPEEMPGLMELPPGFQVTLFAGEPAVQQPICMDFDDRGRLWVAENYSYSGGPYETRLRDRVLIFEDADGDGRHDSRKVFWDKGFMLTSLTWGFGGLWILHDGTLSFIPDRNGDDVPDGEPVVMLDGWSKDCGHNFVSGLVWGPDGWLYGRHGIVDTSYPGVPGTPREQRPFMNCGIWRFHPVQHRIEVVCHGTTNPWGLDYDADGQFFMTNNVQGHLWHVIPGARYQRMYGQDFNPHAYELMDMTADHYHWDTKGKWTDSRDGRANDLGGGHSHVGGLIYQGTNFPESYRGRIFMCNTHGRCVNVDRLERHGSGYVGRHEPNFLQVRTPWFRGVDIKAGPDGTLYIADWSDNGECHDHDGIHRTSGRIYRIAYGTPARVDVAAAVQKAAAQRSWQDWAGRHARRLQQEAAAAGTGNAVANITVATVQDLLWYESLGQIQDAQLAVALQAGNSLLRAQAVQLAAETPARRKAHGPALLALGAQPQPANVLLALVSALQKLDPQPRRALATAILQCQANATTIREEQNLTLMTWYGIEPVVTVDELLPVLDGVPRLQQFAVRRLAHNSGTAADVTGPVLKFISRRVGGGNAEQETAAAQLLAAFRLGLAGRVKVAAPDDWATIERQLRSASSQDVLLSVDAIAVLFGDGAAMADLRELAGNAAADATAREQAIAALAQAQDSAAIPLFFNLLGDRAVYDAVIRALASFDHPDTAKELLNRMGGFKDGNRSLAFDTLASRRPYALQLIAAIEAGRVDARELSAGQVRQLLALNDPGIARVLAERWGVVQETSAARLQAMQRRRAQLTPEVLSQANLQNGADLFRKACATCHKLYGEGKTIGPDITGANRSNLEYLLMNIVDPGAVVAKQFTTSVVALRDGRVITGVIVAETDQSLVVQTDKEQLTVAREQVEEARNTGKSLMPDGLLDSLTDEQVRDLFGYVMQVR